MDINKKNKECSNESCYYMYILVNDDLKMGKGKIAGQVGHVVGLITEEILVNYYTTDKKRDSYQNYILWKNTGQAKIILKATEEQIRSFIGCPETMYILDAGRTQIAPDSLTVLGFYPSNKNRKMLNHFKLL